MFGKPNIQKLEEKKDCAGLIKALSAKEFRTQVAALNALGKLRDPSTASAIINVMKDDDYTVRQVAARIAGEMMLAEAVEPLFALLGDRDDGVKLAAIQALGRLVETDSGGRLAKLQNHSNERVAAAARKAVSEMRSRRGAAMVRVFVSSTFRDMQEERDYLVKRTFPELRRRCHERGVELVEVDLRWGITEEQAERGEVLPICLAEIENCRPYFIGLLGSRYGWVPQGFSPQLLELQPWLANQEGRSVTELEILHGVLNDPEMEKRAFFHFRDPAWIERLPAEQRKSFEAEDEKAAVKLADLKDRIRKSGLPVNENYKDAAALGAAVLDQLWQSIQKDFPADASADEALRLVFEASHRRCFTSRPELFKRLDEHLESGTAPLLVYGEPGSGKTGLLVNWLKIASEGSNPPPFILRFYIGETPKSSSLPWLVHGIASALKERFHLADELPGVMEQDELIPLLPKVLEEAARIGRVVLVIDGLDKLEDRDDALTLQWLPQTFPPNARILLSTGSRAMLSEIESRKWPVLHMPAFSPDEVGRLIPAYLSQFRKSLGPTLVQLIQSCPQSGNPLYLASLLNELKQFGVHEALEERIRDYLQAADTRALFEKILVRLEQDFEKERPGLTGQALSLLCMSRRGLREQELLDMLGGSTGPLPYAYWSPIYLALKETLTQASGLLTFAHEPLRLAVRHRYLSGPKDEKRVRDVIARYFEKMSLLPGVPKEEVTFQMVQDTTWRKVDETAWQLARMQEWGRLRDLLSDNRLVGLAWTLDTAQIIEIFRELAANSSYNILNMYSGMLESPGSVEHAEVVVPYFADLLQALGHAEQAFQLRERLLDSSLVNMPPRQAGDVLVKQGIAYYRAEKLELALKYVERAIEPLKKGGDDFGAQQANMLRGGLLVHLHRAAEALPLFVEEEARCRSENDKEALGYALYMQAGALRGMGQEQDSLEMYDRAMQACTAGGANDILQLCMQEKLDLMSIIARRSQETPHA